MLNPRSTNINDIFHVLEIKNYMVLHAKNNNNNVIRTTQYVHIYIKMLNIIVLGWVLLLSYLIFFM